MANQYRKITYKNASEVPAINPNAIYTVPQAAQLLQLEKRSVYNMIESKDLVAMPAGNSFRIVGQAILAAIPGTSTYNVNTDNKITGSGEMKVNTAKQKAVVQI